MLGPSDGVAPTVDTQTVIVEPTLSSVFVTPGSESGTTKISSTGTYQLDAFALDQFGNPMPSTDLPVLSWAVSDGPGAIDPTTGLLSPTGTSGTIKVTASARDGSGSVTSTPAKFRIVHRSSASSAPAPPTNIVAHAVDGVDIQVAWTDGDNTANGFLIEASVDGGRTYAPLGTASATATSFLATELSSGLHYEFRVTPYNAAGLGTSAESPTTTANEDFTDGWYKISFYDLANPTATSEAFQINTGTDNEHGTIKTANRDWIEADSAADAIRRALSGSFTDSTTGKVYNFPDSGAFEYNSDLELPDGTTVGPAIMVEDHFGVTPADYNWTDAYIPLSVTQDNVIPVADNAVNDSVPSGNIAVGSFAPFDSSAATSDYTATLTWAGAAPTVGVITQNPDGSFAVSVTAVPSGATRIIIPCQ